MPRNVSNSEVTAYLNCTQQYEFAHFLNLEPVALSKPLFRGTLFHESLQHYSLERIAGASHEASLRAGDAVFGNAMRAQPDYMDSILETKMLLTNYHAFYKGWPNLRLLSVEERYDLPLNEDMNITIRYDAMVQEIASGKIYIKDYKTTYEFWTDQDHALNGQMPKYIAVMTANGIEVHGGILDQVRTRKIKSTAPQDHYRLYRYHPSNAKKANVMRQHIATGLQIVDYWNAPEPEREAMTIPALSKYGACSYCNFKDLCASKLDGGDLAFMIETDYKQNTYGYNEAQLAAQENAL